jgi:hypothetical protein
VSFEADAASLSNFAVGVDLTYVGPEDCRRRVFFRVDEPVAIAGGRFQGRYYFISFEGTLTSAATARGTYDVFAYPLFCTGPGFADYAFAAGTWTARASD